MDIDKKDLSRILSSCDIYFLDVSDKEVIKEIEVLNVSNKNDVVVQVLQGHLTMEAVKCGEPIVLREGQCAFWSSEKVVNIRYGEKNDSAINYEQFIINKKVYVRELRNDEKFCKGRTVVRFFKFRSSFYSAMSFFHYLGLPIFDLGNNEWIESCMKQVSEEKKKKDVMARTLFFDAISKMIFVYIVRYMMKLRLFFEKIVAKLSSLQDGRLIELFDHISKNLSGKLTNTELSSIVGCKPDYVGQFVKKKTSFTLQSIVEMSRMEKAFNMLQKSDISVSNVASQTGYSEVSYFSRTFYTFHGLLPSSLPR